MENGTVGLCPLVFLGILYEVKKGMPDVENLSIFLLPGICHLIVFQIFMKFSIEALYKKFSSELEFHENRLIDSHTLFKGLHALLWDSFTFTSLLLIFLN
jgi:hypothetical protein